jgi:hypothetical protein
MAQTSTSHINEWQKHNGRRIIIFVFNWHDVRFYMFIYLFASHKDVVCSLMVLNMLSCDELALGPIQA